jgi:hypothetical protein
MKNPPHLRIAELEGKLIAAHEALQDAYDEGLLVGTTTLSKSAHVLQLEAMKVDLDLETLRGAMRVLEKGVATRSQHDPLTRLQVRIKLGDDAIANATKLREQLVKSAHKRNELVRGMLREMMAMSALVSQLFDVLKAARQWNADNGASEELDAVLLHAKDPDDD